MSLEATRLVEAAARESRSRLLAILTRRTGDLAAAEDALQRAFLKALERWPATGTPRNPEAWLLTAARNSLVDGLRRASTRALAEPDVLRAIEELRSEAEAHDLPERRLELLFACTHPGIDEAIRPALMLNVVLGATAAEIAPCWLVSADAMAQRLVRAKAKIKTAGIPFAVPEPEQYEERVGAVLDAIYAALSVVGETGDFAGEAGYLAALVSRLLPHHAEAGGLRALALQTLAVRCEEGAAFVPLDERDPRSWDTRLLVLADQILTRTARHGEPGRYQLEAAITSAQITQLREGRDTRQAVLHLYRRLLAIAPTIGARCGYAASLLKSGDLNAARTELEAIASEAEQYQPYWAVQGELLEALGDGEGAKSARSKAARLAQEASHAAFLRSKLS